ncbi:MAG: hypothetical protein AUF79_08545 [Crenarchaeota archaeon 13_1_20CM_2_51_8]|nr:MAG: hypothetical protein AUF79_08545 [Crenarchaeota archaeon 13_1_20CM_2_51_8]
MPENFAAVGASYEPAPGAPDVDDLLYLIAVRTLELDVFRGDSHLRLFHQARFFTSLRSLSSSFKLNRLHAHELQLVSSMLLWLL